MSEIDNRPVRVTGYEERRHPAIRQLARACIALARLRLEQAGAKKPKTDNPPTTNEPEQGGGNA